MKKIVALLLSTLLVALSLGGCVPKTVAPAGETASASSAASDAASTAAAGGAPVEITFMDVMPNPDRTTMYEGFIKKFQEQNPTITVKYTSVPFDEAYKKLVAMGSSKTLPDIVTTDVGIMQSLAKAGYIIPLEERFSALPAKDDFTAATITSKNTYSSDGKVFTVPDGYLCQGIFVRTDWLEEAGYKVDELRNWTWDQYFEVNAKLTDPAKGRYGCAFRGGANGGLRFYEYLGSQISAAECFPGGNNVSIYEDPKALEAFTKFYGLYNDGYAPKDSINWGFKEMVEGFVNGQCGTLNQTPEVALTCQQSMEDGTWTVLPHPKNPDAQKNSFVWGYSAGYSISANSQNEESAWKFIEFLSSPEINLEYSKAFGCLPLYKSSLNDAFFQEGVMKGYADALLDPNIQFLEQPSQLSQWGFFLAEFNKNETQKYMTGQQTAEVTLQNLGKFLSEQYDKDIAPTKS